MKKVESVAFVGSVGVPNNYGGFESFLESITPVLVKHVERVSVTCDSSRYLDKNQIWNNVNRIFIPIKANGIFSILHDFIAFLYVFTTHKHIVFLGVSSGIFFPIIKLLSIISRSKIYVNVDGVEYRREKFSHSTRFFLKISDYLSQCFSDLVIIDNFGLSEYVINSKKNKLACIAYSGDQVQQAARNYVFTPFALTVCRIEPENNCELLLDTYANLDFGTYFFIGNWDASRYGRRLKEKYLNNQNILLLNPIYDSKILSSLRSNCFCYLHGHSVGGTNPSLVEMLFYDAPVLAYDCVFNRFTAGDEASYFSNKNELIEKLNFNFTSKSTNPKKISRIKYTRESICNSYLNLFSSQ